VPLKVLRQMIHHPLSDTGIKQFRKDWEAVESGGKTPNAASHPPNGAKERTSRT